MYSGGGIDATGTSWAWSNIVAYNTGGGIQSTSAVAVAYSLAYGSSGQDSDLSLGRDDGENEVADPMLSNYTGTESPSDADITPTTGSPAIDSGPTTGGPLDDWTDTDGTTNDRGYTGGPGSP